MFPQTSLGSVEQHQTVTIALPLPISHQTVSVSAPIAATTSNASSPSNNIPSSGSGSTLSGSSSLPSLSSCSGSGSSSSISSHMTPEDLLNLPRDVLIQIAQRYASESVNQQKSTTSTVPALAAPQHQQHEGQDSNGGSAAPRFVVTEESWKHHAQARAILGNLIGPNGEQLTSMDPYNTTVFVGGLSPLISEETLRTFFAPFGEIHYVRSIFIL